nr:polyprenol phosphomannose-dependent alpha 1,6 mannosyltransferase MptB [Tessaracoccus coleopterorum]
MPGLLVGTHWFETTSVYPSLSLDLFGLLSRVTGGDLYWTLVALRLPSVLALVLLAWVLPRLARRFGLDPLTVLWAGLLNPVMLVQLVGGVHNDALMVALGMAAFLAVTDLGWNGWRGLVVAGVLLGVAMGVKQSAALFGLGVVAVAWGLRRHRGGGWLGAADGRGWLRLAAVAVVPGLITITTFLLTSVSWGLGWRNPTAGNPIGATSNAPMSWIASFLRYHEVFSFPVANAVVSTVSTVLIGALVLVLWVWIGPRGSGIGRPWVFAVGVLVAFNVVGPALQPWYLTWVLPLFAFVRGPAAVNRVWLVTVCAFAMLPPLQDLLPPYISMFVVALPLGLGLSAMRRRGSDPLPVSDHGVDPFKTSV